MQKFSFSAKNTKIFRRRWVINLALVLEKSVERYPDRPALIADSRRVTYAELDNAVKVMMSHLRRLGIKQGDKVALMLPNIPEFVYCYFAIIRVGAVAVLLNTSSTPYELTYLLDNCDAKIIITQAAGEKKYNEIKDRLTSCHQAYIISPEGITTGSDKDKNFNVGDVAPVTIEPDDPAQIIYTAGLTGKPLGAVLTHGNLCAELNMIQPIFRRQPDDVGLCLIPLFHSFGATVNMLNVIQAGWKGMG